MPALRRAVALDAAAPTAGGLAKHRVAAKPGQDAHDLACVRLAVHLGWLDDPAWATREALRYDAGAAGRPATLVPDFSRRADGGLWCVEVEGTTEARHIRAKHRRYGSLFRDLARRRGPAFRGQLTVVFTSAAVCAQVLRAHELAYVTQPWGYDLRWATLDVVLAGDRRGGLAPACAAVDYEAVRSRWREHHDRQLRALGR